jgi:hypothetical protein
MIFVDPLMACIPTAQWRWTRSCHLFALPHQGQTQEQAERELHLFAKGIGMRMSWYQGDHYDLTPEKRERAVLAGAIEISRDDPRMRQWLELRRNKRNG